MSATRPPATAQEHLVDGLAVTRRRHDDVAAELPTVVLVHGAMDRAASFGRVMRRLSALDVVAYDRRGYAGSLHAGVAADLTAHVDDLCRIIEWSGATSVVVVGHSLGGTIALRLAQRGTVHPREGSTALSISELSGTVPSSDRRRWTLPGIAAFEFPVPSLHETYASVGAGAIEIAETDGAEAGAEHFYRMMVGDHTWSRLRERDRSARRAEGPALISELLDLRNPEASPVLDQIDLPVLVGIGSVTSDRLSGTAVEAASLLPRGRLHVIDGAGHGAHLANPDAFATYATATIAYAGVGGAPTERSGPT